jgi:hypothetical protein
MTAKVLVVDDEPDLEELVRQRFHCQIKEGSRPHYTVVKIAYASAISVLLSGRGGPRGFCLCMGRVVYVCSYNFGLKKDFSDFQHIRVALHLICVA